MNFESGDKLSIEKISNHMPNTIRAFKRDSVTTYEEFIDLLYESMDEAIDKLERNPQYYINDDEDKLTYSIATLLQQIGYNARHGHKNGGNIDLFVEHSKSEWSWCGEAKIFNQIDNINEAFLQLTTRYRNNSVEYNQRGILIYIKKQDASKYLGQWRNMLFDKDGVEILEDERKKLFAFFSEHKDNSSGVMMKIRHRGICLYHLPEDKSGRSAKKYQKVRESISE
ncbi:hypothetical protein V8J88_11680 [Massilia sp. W12]|uniref:hypothetical protein n=1 Tax=Massilia sp. W12 TaxID=3126507 RepID=UPI0030CCDF41